MKTFEKDGKLWFECGCSFDIVGEPVGKSNIPRVRMCSDLHNPNHTINFACQATWDLLGKGFTKGVFQLESQLGKQWCKKLKPENKYHMAALGSILRPGCMRAKSYYIQCKECNNKFPIEEDNKAEENICPGCGNNQVKKIAISMTEHYCLRKNGEEAVEKYHPVVDNVLGKSYNCLIYQEQAMLLARELANFNLQEADVLRKCVTDDTMFVSKTRGWITIKELLETSYKEDLFLIMNESGKQEWKKINNIWCTGKHDVNEIETRSGLSVKSTKNHQFLTNYGWKARQKLNKEDYIVCAKTIDFDGEDRWPYSLYMVIAGLITEGYFTENKGCHFTNYDVFMMDIFLQNYQKYFGHKPNILDPKVAKINVADKKHLNKFLSFGKSAKKYLPKEMMRSSKSTCRDFLSFMLGAEGGVCVNNNSFEFSSSSKYLCKQIQLLLKRFSIHSYIIIRKNSGYKDEDGNFVNCGPSYKLYINDQRDQELLFNNLSYYWPVYKRQDLEKILKKSCIKNFTTHIVPSNIVNRLLNQYPSAGNYEGGSIYKENISIDRFIKICKKTNDIEWIDFSKGNQYYDQIKDMSIKTREIYTYDFSMEDCYHPYIIANGIVIHNSIGKKLPEEMAKVKILFLKKAKEAKIVSDHQAEEIFGWIEKSQRYSFNLSHAASYGETGYICAYAKTHFPLAFYRKWLEFAYEKQKPHEEIAELVNDARITSNIKIRTPDIRFLKNTVHTDGENIYFGIKDIKDIGESQSKKIQEIFEIYNINSNNISEIGWLLFMMYIGDQISSRTILNLIKSGSLSCFNIDRVIMERDILVWLSLTDKEKYLSKKYYSDINKSPENTEEIIENIIKYKFYHAKPRLNQLLEKLENIKNPLYNLQDTVDYIVKSEEELLGVALTCHITDSLLTARETHSCKDIAKGYKGYAVLKVNLDNIKLWKCKNDKYMAFIKASDNTCQLDNIIAFTEVYNTYSHLLSPQNIVYITGQISKKGSFVIERIYEHQ